MTFMQVVIFAILEFFASASERNYTNRNVLEILESFQKGNLHGLFDDLSVIDVLEDGTPFKTLSEKLTKVESDLKYMSAWLNDNHETIEEDEDARNCTSALMGQAFEGLVEMYKANQFCTEEQPLGDVLKLVLRNATGNDEAASSLEESVSDLVHRYCYDEDECSTQMRQMASFVALLLLEPSEVGAPLMEFVRGSLEKEFDCLNRKVDDLHAQIEYLRKEFEACTEGV